MHWESIGVTWLSAKRQSPLFHGPVLVFQQVARALWACMNVVIGEGINSSKECKVFTKQMKEEVYIYSWC